MEREVGLEWKGRRPIRKDELRIDLRHLISMHSVVQVTMLLTARKLQYSRLIRTSMGALATLSTFLT